jgi:hypothetical protein
MSHHWREEKAGFVAQSICRVLASPETPEDIKHEIGGEGLYNALKLYAEALECRIPSGTTRWSPALVEGFRKEPERCSAFLVLMAEPEFSADEYWS